MLIIEKVLFESHSLHESETMTTNSDAPSSEEKCLFQ